MICRGFLGVFVTKIPNDHQILADKPGRNVGKRYGMAEFKRRYAAKGTKRIPSGHEHGRDKYHGLVYDTGFECRGVDLRAAFDQNGHDVLLPSPSFQLSILGSQCNRRHALSRPIMNHESLLHNVIKLLTKYCNYGTNITAKTSFFW